MARWSRPSEWTRARSRWTSRSRPETPPAPSPPQPEPCESCTGAPTSSSLEAELNTLIKPLNFPPLPDLTQKVSPRELILEQMATDAWVVQKKLAVTPDGWTQWEDVAVEFLEVGESVDSMLRNYLAGDPEGAYRAMSAIGLRTVQSYERLDGTFGLRQQDDRAAKRDATPQHGTAREAEGNVVDFTAHRARRPRPPSTPHPDAG